MLANAALLLLAAARVAHTAPAGNPGLRGSESLLGYDASNVLSTENTADVGPVDLTTTQTEDADIGAYIDFSNDANPQPIRGSKGGTDPGPRSKEIDRLNSDKLAPPGTDHAQTINAQWSLGDSHTKMGLDRAGYSKQENTVVMPDATKMAGVDMRLEAGAYRELHWHVAGEWSIVLNGSARIAAVQQDGKTFVDDVSKGDVWFFPPGIPHSIQGLDGGVEFLLVFDDGGFSEDNTFLASEIFAHNPKEVIAKDLDIEVSDLDDIPSGELFIFPGTPAPKDIQAQNISGSAGVLSKADSYSYHFSEQPAHEVAGGSVKIIDPLTFPIAPNFSAALVTIKPGAMREIHWHTTSDEWAFFIAGTARGTLFTAPKTATTFDFRAGDVGYFPQSNSHYIENVGDDDVILLEVLQADQFTDMSLGQWLGETPPQIVKDTLNLSNATVAKLKKEKQYVVQGS
ncbi:putative oxalate decarboxylase [Saccharata proteae CBS 121410]|uniref:Oxalate decarboxylase n=1 Tax=Saccharata proteae CBS 121410 TaxID=1314787 RepID=A0A9P4HSY6_9PEZI|nr:putative oxalate decarboxylase [Saccharata proteae CBS 121410]